jgi:ATP-dependent Clp protease ATP-binding subunit ClpA
MFERYTEKARRAIFFARFEASQYGSHTIEPEHLLLGILREDCSAIQKHVPKESNLASEIREEIEKRITRAERVSTSVEMPLSIESKRALKLAAETSEQLGHRTVDTEHFLVGLLLVEKSMAAQILMARGLTASAVRSQISPQTKPASNPVHESAPNVGGEIVFEAFVAGLASKSAELVGLIATQAEFIDVAGRRWSYHEIRQEFDFLFAPYATKNVTSELEWMLSDNRELFAATVLWKNVPSVVGHSARTHRMSFVLSRPAEKWDIVLIQVTEVQPR